MREKDVGQSGLDSTQVDSSRVESSGFAGLILLASDRFSLPRGLESSREQEDLAASEPPCARAVKYVPILTKGQLFVEGTVGNTGAPVFAAVFLVGSVLRETKDAWARSTGGPMSSVNREPSMTRVPGQDYT